MAQEVPGEVSVAQAAEESADPDGVVTATRSRRRRNVIGGSPHREEYVRLIGAGWSSFALERYAQHRFGEEIPASTFRSYKNRSKIKVEESPWKAIVDGIQKDGAVDVLAVRSEMITLQRARIAIDAQHEADMKKLFSTTRGEMAELGRMLDAYMGDLQALGVMPSPKGGLVVEAGPSIRPPQAGDATPDGQSLPKAKTLGELLGTQDPEIERQMAKVLHLSARQAESNGAAG